MRKISLILTALLFITAMNAQELKVIKLNAPDKARGTAVMKAFSDRHSDREYAAKEISMQDLSDLLWAANGINRTDGKRTAPSALNKQDIDVYVILKDGAYLYDAQAHALNPIAKGDHRAAVGGGQDFCERCTGLPCSGIRPVSLRKGFRPDQTDGCYGRRHCITEY